jgi:RNA recognition motif-containing protein
MFKLTVVFLMSMLPFVSIAQIAQESEVSKLWERGLTSSKESTLIIEFNTEHIKDSVSLATARNCLASYNRNLGSLQTKYNEPDMTSYTLSIPNSLTVDSLRFYLQTCGLVTQKFTALELD